MHNVKNIKGNYIKICILFYSSQHYCCRLLQQQQRQHKELEIFLFAVCAEKTIFLLNNLYTHIHKQKQNYVFLLRIIIAKGNKPKFKKK